MSLSRVRPEKIQLIFFVLLKKFIQFSFFFDLILTWQASSAFGTHFALTSSLICLFTNNNIQRGYTSHMEIWIEYIRNTLSFAHNQKLNFYWLRSVNKKFEKLHVKFVLTSKEPSTDFITERHACRSFAFSSIKSFKLGRTGVMHIILQMCL